MQFIFKDSFSKFMNSYAKLQAATTNTTTTQLVVDSNLFVTSITQNQDNTLTVLGHALPNDWEEYAHVLASHDIIVNNYPLVEKTFDKVLPFTLYYIVSSKNKGVKVWPIKM